MTGYSVTVADAEFTPSDRRAALEYQAEEAVRCDRCGEPRDESMGSDGPEYNARPIRCRGCEALIKTAQIHAGHEDIDPSAGMRWQLTKE